MKMKKPLWNSRFGNKGFAFSLDAVIAVIIFTIVLVTATYYVTRSEESMLPNLQMVRTGSDVVAVLDHEGMFKSELFEQQIRDKMYELLPTNYDMRLEIDHKCICSGPSAICSEIEKLDLCENNFSIGNDIPDDRFVASGKRFFVNIISVEYEGATYPNVFYYGKAEYRVWLK